MLSTIEFRAARDREVMGPEVKGDRTNAKNGFVNKSGLMVVMSAQVSRDISQILLLRAGTDPWHLLACVAAR
jgi:hypothetical protein